MNTGLSQRIVTFIGHLLPLYVEEQVDDLSCARSLSDGTLILPVEEDPDDEVGWVTVHWQGDPARQTTVQGPFMASIAVARYVELHHLATNTKAIRAEMEHMSQHFAVKTGESLVFESPDSELIEWIAKAAGKVGEKALIEVLKKLVGL